MSRASRGAAAAAAMLAWATVTAPGQWDTNAWSGDFWRVYEDGSSNMIPIASTIVTQAFEAASERATALMREEIEPPETTNVWRWHHDSLVTLKAWVTNNAPLFLDTSWGTNMPAAWNAVVYTQEQDYVLAPAVYGDAGYTCPAVHDYPLWDPPLPFTTVSLLRVSYPLFFDNRTITTEYSFQDMMEQVLWEEDCENDGAQQSLYYAPRLTVARIVSQLGLPSDYFTFTPHRALFAATNTNGWLPMRDVLNLLRYELREPVRWVMTDSTNNAVRSIAWQRHDLDLFPLETNWVAFRSAGWTNITVAADESIGGHEVSDWEWADDIPHPGRYVRVSLSQSPINSLGDPYRWSAVRYSMQATPRLEGMPLPGAEVRFFGIVDRLPVGSYGNSRTHVGFARHNLPARAMWWTYAARTVRDAADTNQFIVAYEDFDDGAEGYGFWGRRHDHVVVQMDMDEAIEWAPTNTASGELVEIGVGTSLVSGVAEGQAFPDTAEGLPAWTNTPVFVPDTPPDDVLVAHGMFDVLAWQIRELGGASEPEYADYLYCATHEWRATASTYEEERLATMWAASQRSAGWALDVSLALIDWDPAFSYRAAAE